MGGKREADLAPAEGQAVGAGSRSREPTGCGVARAASGRTDASTIAAGGRVTGVTTAATARRSAGVTTASASGRLAVERACEAFGRSVDLQPLLVPGAGRHE